MVRKWDLQSRKRNAATTDRLRLANKIHSPFVGTNFDFAWFNSNDHQYNNSDD